MTCPPTPRHRTWQTLRNFWKQPPCTVKVLLLLKTGEEVYGERRRAFLYKQPKGFWSRDPRCKHLGLPVIYPGNADIPIPTLYFIRNAEIARWRSLRQTDGEMEEKSIEPTQELQEALQAACQKQSEEVKALKFCGPAHQALEKMQTEYFCPPLTVNNAELVHELLMPFHPNHPKKDENTGKS